MDQWLEEIRAALPELVVYQQEPMKKHTTFRVGGPADLYVCPKKQELPVILGLAKKKGLAVTVIGNGSNLLVGDKGIRGLVIEVGAQMNAVEVQGNILRAQAGALLSQVAAKAAAAGLGGMEFAAGIPGSMGGAVTMNAGAYGGEMKDVIQQVTVLTPECEQKVLSREELDLSYRHSCIPKNQFSCKIAFRTLKRTACTWILQRLLLHTFFPEFCHLCTDLLLRCWRQGQLCLWRRNERCHPAGDSAYPGV